jgi:hypothetical protein
VDCVFNLLIFFVIGIMSVRRPNAVAEFLRKYSYPRGYWQSVSAEGKGLDRHIYAIRQVGMLFIFFSLFLGLIATALEIRTIPKVHQDKPSVLSSEPAFKR